MKITAKGHLLSTKEQQHLPIGTKVIINNYVCEKKLKDDVYGFFINDYIFEAKIGRRKYGCPCHMFPVYECVEYEVDGANQVFNKINAMYTSSETKPEFDWDKFKNGELIVRCANATDKNNFINLCLYNIGNLLDYEDARKFDIGLWSTYIGYSNKKIKFGLIKEMHTCDNDKNITFVKFEDFDFSSKPKKRDIVGNIHYKIKNNETFVTVNKNTGKAKKNPIDSNDNNIGILIATARALKIDENKIQGIIDTLFETKKEKTIKDFSNNELLDELRIRL